MCLGEVAVTAQVVGYLRRLPSGEVLDQIPLDLPERTLSTRAVWYTIGEELLQLLTFLVAELERGHGLTVVATLVIR